MPCFKELNLVVLKKTSPTGLPQIFISVSFHFSLPHFPSKRCLPLFVHILSVPATLFLCFNIHPFLVAVSVFHCCAPPPHPPSEMVWGQPAHVSPSPATACGLQNSTIPPFQIACFLARRERAHTHSLPPAKWSTHTSSHAYLFTYKHTHTQQKRHYISNNLLV